MTLRLVCFTDATGINYAPAALVLKDLLRGNAHALVASPPYVEHGYWPMVFLNSSRRLLYFGPHSKDESTRKSVPGSGVHLTSRRDVQ